MNRGDLFRVRKPSARDPKRSRVFLVVSREVLIDSRLSTVICAPVYSSYRGLSTQVPVAVDEGLEHESAIHCDELVSLPKSAAFAFAPLDSSAASTPSAALQRARRTLRMISSRWPA